MEDNKEILDINRTLNSKDVKAEVDRVRAIDPVAKLRLAIFESYEFRLKELQADSDLKELLIEELKEDLRNHTLSPAQKIALLSQLSQNETLAYESAYGILKPSSGGAVSPVFTNMNEDKDKEINSILNKIGSSPNSNEGLLKLIRAIQAAEKG